MADEVVGEGLEELQPVGNVVDVPLGDGFPRDVVQVQLDDGGDLLDDLLYLLPRAQGALRDLEDIDHAVGEDDLVDLEVNVLVLQRLDVPDVPLDPHVLENIHSQVYYL